MFVFAYSDLSAQTGVSAKPDAPSTDTIISILQKNVGQNIELHLRSGEKIAGKVDKVGNTLIHLSQLTGMELFEADVNIADVSAVVARTKKG